MYSIYIYRHTLVICLYVNMYVHICIQHTYVLRLCRAARLAELGGRRPNRQAAGRRRRIMHIGMLKGGS